MLEMIFCDILAEKYHMKALRYPKNSFLISLGYYIIMLAMCIYKIRCNLYFSKIYIIFNIYRLLLQLNLNITGSICMLYFRGALTWIILLQYIVYIHVYC